MFNDIIGQKLPKKILTAALKNDDINHAYIFYGPSGVGKMKTAKKLSQYLICKNGTACMQCTPCKQFLANTVDDFKVVSCLPDKSEILVDQIREIVADVYIRPHIFDKKIYIIDNADKMNIKAQNAFLKVLEEPPEYAVFILIAESLSKLLPTIRSRGNEIRFSFLNISELKEIYQKNFGSPLPDDITEISGGSIENAINLMNASETEDLRKSFSQAFISFLKKPDSQNMLNSYKELSQNEQHKDMLIKLMYTVLSDCFTFETGNAQYLHTIYSCEDISLSLEKLRKLFLCLDSFLKITDTNANYSLAVLTMFTKLQRILIY